MRTDTFLEEHPVSLSEEERNVRGRQAARLTVALEHHRERAKEVKKKLRDEETEIEEQLCKAAAAAEHGEEQRQVECREVLRGAMVETLRTDTGETVASRPATREEMGVAPAPAPKAKAKKKPDEGDDGIVDDSYPVSH